MQSRWVLVVLAALQEQVKVLLEAIPYLIL
jgi:hypothetical protein